MKTHIKNVITDISITIGTNHDDTTSTSFCIGALLLCALETMSTMFESIVSFPTFLALITIEPLLFIVPAITYESLFFNEAIGSSEGINIRGKNKAMYLVDRFGEKGFDYAGNDFSDLAIWVHSQTAILVHPLPRLAAKVPEENRVVIEEDRVSVPRAFLKAIRPHQWMKNLLIFIPLVTAHDPYAHFGLDSSFLHPRCQLE